MSDVLSGVRQECLRNCTRRQETWCRNNAIALLLPREHLAISKMKYILLLSATFWSPRQRARKIQWCLFTHWYCETNLVSFVDKLSWAMEYVEQNEFFLFLIKGDGKREGGWLIHHSIMCFFLWISELLCRANGHVSKFKSLLSFVSRWQYMYSRLLSANIAWPSKIPNHKTCCIPARPLCDVPCTSCYAVCFPVCHPWSRRTPPVSFSSPAVACPAK
jgi:hypothetical protein